MSCGCAERRRSIGDAGRAIARRDHADVMTELRRIGRSIKRDLAGVAAWRRGSKSGSIHRNSAGSPR
jgi:hypothetical protein